MGLMGFPSARDMSEMFGFVTDEDRDKWEKSREAGKERDRNRGSAKDMAGKSAAPALDLAKRGIEAQMHGEQNEAKRGSQPKQRTRVTRETVTEHSRNVDSLDEDYGADF